MKHILLASLALLSSHAHAALITAQDDDLLGLYSASSFATLSAANPCKDCKITPQALWYFKHELIAVPPHNANVEAFSSTLNAQQDFANLNTKALPPLVWLGSGLVIPQAKLSDNGNTIALQTGESLKFAIVPKISTNLSYWNASTLDFFKAHEVRLRGEIVGTQFVARTIWPLDYKLDLNAKMQPLTNETLRNLVEQDNSKRAEFSSRLLYGSAESLAGKPVLALILNGAQGDDDEAHGGHFAVATGRVGANGDIGNWLVNNYYNLASNSEKGIIAAPTPLDKYMADLNNGQSYYRPSVMLVAVLKQDRVPAQFQAATNRVYQHFYRNDFVYDHSRDNCASISINTLRNLGWKIPERGVESYLKATAAYFMVSAKELSLSKGRAIYDYLSTEKTRLYPAQAFDVIGERFQYLTHPNLKVLHPPIENQFTEDIEAIYFVRIPQIPSSRAFGSAPVYSFDEYMRRVPKDAKDWKTVPTTPNPLPENLKDGLALKLEKPSLVPLPVAAVLFVVVAALIWLVRKLRKKSR